MTTSGDLTCKIKKVKEIEGEGSVAVVRGKKRYLFDFSFEGEFEMVVDDDDAVATGTIKIPDVSSTVEKGEWEIEMSFKTGRNRENVTEASGIFKTAIKSSLDAFVDDFNASY